LDTSGGLAPGPAQNRRVGGVDLRGGEVILGWRRAALVLTATAVVSLALSPLGRHERADASRSQGAGIADVDRLARAHPLGAWRSTHWADCLLHRVGDDPYALEVCYDADGRAIEAIDRRVRSRTRIWTIRSYPQAATTRVPPVRLYALFRRIGAFPPSLRFAGTLPLADSLSLPADSQGDSGPVLIRGRAFGPATP